MFKKSCSCRLAMIGEKGQWIYYVGLPFTNILRIKEE